jgi:hypothetical protein
LTALWSVAEYRSKNRGLTFGLAGKALNDRMQPTIDEEHRKPVHQGP